MHVTDKATRQCSQTATFEERVEPKQDPPEILLLTIVTLYRRAKTGSPKISCGVSVSSYFKGHFAPFQPGSLGYSVMTTLGVEDKRPPCALGRHESIS